jgi:CubicO group peptidase (beta-lactamase class C family)
MALSAILLACSALVLAAEKLPVSSIADIFAGYQGPDAPGASVIVIHHGKVVYRNAFGRAKTRRVAR